MFIDNNLNHLYISKSNECASQLESARVESKVNIRSIAFDEQNHKWSTKD